MKKNLLLIHLESLNMLNYKMNPELFPVLTEFEKYCRVFNRYYSTATSTLMVVADLLYGGLKIYEGCSTLADIPAEYSYTSSLFDDLKEQGYYTGVATYPYGPDCAAADARHIAGFQNTLEVIRQYPEYIDFFSEGMDKQPFALMSCNCISNVSLNTHVDINDYGMDVDAWEAGYRCMDQCCGTLLKLLKEKHLIENTIIVMYGDHGDDYWGHGMHSGLTHAIEPNELLIHVPLFVWDSIQRNEPEIETRLIQTSDLRGMINSLLREKNEVQDIVSSRSYVISRNEYAAQPVRADSFNKAYSVIDGRYLLMVSGKGLEMYDTRMDPACQCNMLNFFVYENEVLIDNKACNQSYVFHFPSYWSSRRQRILRQKFYELKDVLYNDVKELYIAGGRKESDLLNEMKFEIIAG